MRLGQFRRDTLANWQSKNPVINDGEFILIAPDASKPNKYTYWAAGDGVSTFSQLTMATLASSTGITGLTQETGTSTSLVMSQKAVTDKLTAEETRLTAIETKITSFESRISVLETKS